MTTEQERPSSRGTSLPLWRHVRWLYLFVVALVVNLVFSLIQSALTATSPADVLDPTHLQQTWLGQFAIHNSVAFWVAIALCLGLSGFGWYVQRQHQIRLANQTQEQQDEHLNQVVDLRLSDGRQVTLTTGHDMIPINLGNREEATFPYTKDAIRHEYEETVGAIERAKHRPKRGEGKRGVLILGPTNAGKTRLADQLIRQNLGDWSVLVWNTSLAPNDLPSSSKLHGKNLAVFIDDLQQYIAFDGKDRSEARDIGATGRHEVDVRSSSRYGQLQGMLYRLESDVKQLVIVTTFDGDIFKAKGTLDWLIDDLAVIQIPSFSKDPEDPQAKAIIGSFARQGAPYSAADWDGTIGSLILGPKRRQNEYARLANSGDSAAAILKAMKLLSVAGITNYTDKRIRSVCRAVFGADALDSDDNAWQEAMQRLVGAQLVARTQDNLGLEIEKDNYFNTIVTDYLAQDDDSARTQAFTVLKTLFMDMQDADALTSLGYSYRAIQRDDDALLMAKQAIDLAEENHLPPDFRAWNLSALALADLGQSEDRLAAYDRMVILFEEQAAQAADAWEGKGETLFGLGRYEEALTAFEQTLKKDPQREHLWRSKGDTFFNLARYDEALSAYSRWLEGNPTDDTILTYKGDTLLKLERPADAVKAYDQALAIDPNSMSATLNKVTALNALKRPDQARETLEQALQARVVESDQMPSTSEAWLSKLLEGLDSDPEKFFKRLLRGPGVIWNERGRLLSAMQRYDQAITAYDQALAFDGPDATVLTNKGDALFELKRYDEALAIFDEALTLDPNNTLLLAYKGDTLANLQRPAEAVAAYDQMLAPYDAAQEVPLTLAPVALARGDQLSMLRRYDAAVRDFDTVLALDPVNTEALRSKGDALYNARHFIEALGSYERALALLPEKADLYNRKADTLYEMRSYDDAVVACDKALALDPYAVFAALRKAAALQALERPDEARATLEQALRVFDDGLKAAPTSELWKGRGALLNSLKRFAEALDAFVHVIALDPTSASGWSSKGVALYNMGSFVDAVVAYDEALRLNPKDATVWFNKADALANLGRDEDAITSYDKALAIDPAMVEALISRGQALSRLKRFDEAVIDFDKALALEPKNAVAWGSKGDALDESRRYEEAVSAYESASTFAPQNADLWRSRGRVLDRLQRDDEALAAYSQAVILSPTSAPSWQGKAISLNNLGRQKDALDAFEEALKLDADDATIWSAKGDTLYNMANYDDAIVAYERAIQLNPDWSYPRLRIAMIRQTVDRPHSVAEEPEGNLDSGQIQMRFEQDLQLNAVNLEASASVDLWIERGSILNSLEKYDDALAAFDQALALDPKDASAWSAKGESLFNLKRFDAALEAYEHTVALAPKYAANWVDKGRTLHVMHHYDEAVIAYDRALDLNRTSAPTWIAKGNALIDARKYEDAVTAFDQALIFDSKNLDALFAKGQALERAEQYDRLRATYEQALSIDGSSFDAMLGYAWSLKLLRLYAESLVVYEKVLKLDPRADVAAAAWNGMGYVWRDRERYDEAVSCIEKAIELAPEDANYRDSLGEMYLSAHRYELALTSLDEALKRDPEFAPAWRKKAKLFVAQGRRVDADRADRIAQELER
jgi:tetratricopeptide (TPR) repeat protein